MTEPEEDPVDLRYAAAILCGFDRYAWPEPGFEPHQLMRLMAGGGPTKKPMEWKLAMARIEDGMAAGTLKTVDVDQGFEEVEHDAAGLTDAERFKKAVFPKYDSFTGRNRFVWYERRKKAPKRYITREACRDWLHAIKKTPPRLVRAWLGPAWQEEAPKVDAGDTAPTENPKRQKLRAMLERIKGIDRKRVIDDAIDSSLVDVVAKGIFSDWPAAAKASGPRSRRRIARWEVCGTG